MILPARGQRTTEFYATVVGGLVVQVLGFWMHWDAAIYSGAILQASYAVSRGIAKAGFGRAVHETHRRVV